ncbi:glycerol-3-phosphate acyltransferase [Lysinibacillus sp. MHQ-1]|nr:glycerol-3-phosphate acyltransferase [Lysinibacillus sp. MHQ-1]
MGFNGGKGTASIIGILLAVDWKIGLFALILFVILSFATNYLIVGVLEFYLVFLYRYLFMDSWIRPNHYCHSTFWYCYYFAL